MRRVDFPPPASVDLFTPSGHLAEPRCYSLPEWVEDVMRADPTYGNVDRAALVVRVQDAMRDASGFALVEESEWQAVRDSIGRVTLPVGLMTAAVRAGFPEAWRKAEKVQVQVHVQAVVVATTPAVRNDGDGPSA